MRALILIVLFASPFSHATVVFIDVNNSRNEVETARKRAKAKGEDFVVWPDHDIATAKKVKQYLRNVKDAAKAYDKVNCYGQMLCDGKYTSGDCDKLNKATADAHDKVQALTKDKLSPDAITAGLQGIYAKGKSVSSVIISGEDGGSVFGVFGTLKYEDLKAAFDKVPQLKNDVLSVYLWGCYTGTAERYSEVWKDTFPKAKLMAGFFDAGPADTSDPGYKLLGNLMQAEAKAFKTYGEKAVRNFFNGFKEIKQVNASMCVNGQYIDAKHNFPLSEFKADGEKCVAGFPKKLHEVFSCYLKADEKCPSPPKDHQSGELREYNSYLRKNQHCLSNPFFQNAIPSAGNPDQAIRLIYFDRIWDNFLDNHGQDMKKLNTLLKALGVPDDAQFSGDKNMSRRDLMQWMTKVNGYLAKMEGEKAQYVKGVMGSLDNTMVNLSRWTIPDAWIAGSSREKPHYPFEVKADCNATK